jgi:Tfp pilus assembly protein PilO
MSRTQIVLSALIAVLTVALYWLVLWQPQSEAIATTEQQLVDVQAQQAEIQAEITRLQGVREAAPQAEAELAALSSIVPDGSAMPSLLRQMQVAADDAGLSLTSVTVGRPSEELTPEALVADLPVTAAVEGSYFQIVDFLRRLEDPSLSPRGVLWDSLAVATGEYPALTTTLTGRTFADAEAVVPPQPVEEAPAGEGEGTEDEAGEEPADSETASETDEEVSS